MTATLERPVASDLPVNGGLPARRAVVRWAWRLFRREWRQQLLILALVVVAVAATIVGSTVATNARQPSTFGFGTAQDSATYTGSPAHIAGEVAHLRRRFGPVEVIENATFPFPGSINTYSIRAQNPSGPFSKPMLALVSGRYPTGSGEVAVTRGVAAAFDLKVGDVWHRAGVDRRVVGMVKNPLSLLDEFALVAPGQVAAPTQVIALFDAPGVSPQSVGPTVQTPASVARSNPLNPETISLAALVLGMLLIALVSIGGFTVLAQRRLRSIGMLESLGATDGHVSLVVRANGVVVGAVGAVVGFVMGLAVWVAYRPSLEQSSHHDIGLFALPWLVVALAMVLAVAATYFAASRPARAMTKVPVVAALSGRPAAPKQVGRSAVPGIVLLVASFVLLGLSGSTTSSAAGGGGGGMPELLFGLVTLVPGMILLAPFCLTLLARAGRRAPIAVRLALGDLARYRARSGSALAAISVGVLVAVIIVLAAAARYGNVLDYAGPNLASNQLALHTNQPPPPGSIIISPHHAPKVATAPKGPTATPSQLAASAQRIATALGARLIPLDSPGTGIGHVGGGRGWNGTIYVATPRLLAAFGIKSSDIRPDTDIVTARPGLSGVSGLFMRYGGNPKEDGGGPAPATGPNGAIPSCTAATHCLANPVIQELGSLPAGTAAPNTLITERAMTRFHLRASTSDWLVQRTQPITDAQIRGAELTASNSQLSVESKNDEPSSAEVIDWATAFGILLALGVLAMSVGLIRSETAGDLRTLTATGASSVTRRSLTAVTAGALGFLGALIGTAGGYFALIGWLRGNSLNGGISALTSVPIVNLLLILVGMPVVAAAGGWLLAGREPSGIPQRAME